MLIAFSTAEGELAYDVGERAGPYATVLAEEIVKPGLEAITVFRNVQLRVSARLRQKPWTQNGPIGETYFAGKAQPPLSEAAQAWQAVQNSENENVLEDFIRRYGDTIYGNLARAKLAELRATVTIRIPLTICQNPNIWVSLAGRGGKCLKPGSGASFRDCWKDGNSDVCGPEMVVVPAGQFLLGSPKDESGRGEDEDNKPGEGGDQVQVTIATPFAAGKFEVTFEEWDACVRRGGCQTKNNKEKRDMGWGRGKQPLVGASWTDAQQYVRWLNAKVGGSPYRLLSEAEWEYTARAGGTTRYVWGNDLGKNNANCRGCGSQWDKKQTAPIGSFRPSGWGLHDMHGNAAEWVQDCYADSYDTTPRDGAPREISGDCSSRVLRGGSWDHDPERLRATDRDRLTPEYKLDLIGFRVARTLKP